ncbi:hypothetical protein CLOSTMETH_03938 [[Clostridium] methylpentosum DSM 5476]|uniref:Uncharacterized protein n=1 Tax=[Clostridium] methylpentosum DSM 5476 TaxID=537013 RepID=C0EJ85_9FIRM|nr:hypothetical protein CLOSTMETH_03938 [[Clostridium] methylpentosum DSM 5476]
MFSFILPLSARFVNVLVYHNSSFFTISVSLAQRTQKPMILLFRCAIREIFQKKIL